jgi:hypothetical protein
LGASAPEGGQSEGERADMTQQSEQLIAQMAKDIKEIHNAIYVGNGKTPIMARLTRLETWVKVLIGGTSLAMGAIIPLVLTKIFG